jgi:FlaA1/EpsC-like NDP-sugar epimerase
MDIYSVMGFPRWVKMLILFCIDAVLASMAYWLATIARFGRIPTVPVEQILMGTAVAAVLVPTLALVFGFYRSMTRYLAPHLPARAGAVSASAGTVLAAIASFGGARPLQAIGFGFVFTLATFALLLLSRAAARWLLGGSASGWAPVAIYGAGSAGRQLAAMLMRGDQLRPVAFIDDDRKLRGRSIEDLPVLNPLDEKFSERLRARKVREVLIAIPSLKPSRRRQMLEFLSDLSLRVRSVPALAELMEKDEKNIGDLVDVSVDDLLGRDPVAPLPGLLDTCIRGKTVLVTGGGGSIGSELCRQAIALRPKKLIVIEHSELALYAIEQELRDTAAKTGVHCEREFVLGSVADRSRVDSLFRANAIDAVYHAAAYKHVPIVELNPLEGFRNNVFGTWLVARAALEAGVQHFVLISTDKAVRPTNVMGATKRIAELVLEAIAGRASRTAFSMVRFGNVLESSGSVVPLFRKQIAAGGPITLTHPDVTRYFMTIPEAVELVIQAGAMAHGGELFVLDMGSPVKIRELAERMVRLTGLSVRDDANPGGDIAIEVTGLRPGEKLHEELLIDGEVTGTVHPRILQMRERAMDLRVLEGELARLEGVGHDEAAQGAIRSFFAKWVAGYVDQVTRVDPVPLRAVPTGSSPY